MRSSKHLPGVRFVFTLALALGFGWRGGPAVLQAAGQGANQGTGQVGLGVSNLSQAGRFIVHSQTNVVLVDVRVWNKKGQPITDLKQGDFRIFEDGVPQKITSFSFENIEGLVQAQQTPTPTINLAKLAPTISPAKIVQNHRMFVLYFDLTSMPVEDLMRAYKASESFVKSEMTPADLVAVVIYSSDLRVLQTFTNDRDLLDKALQSIRVGESSSLAEAGSEGEPGTTNASGQEVVAQDVSAPFTPDETEFNIFNTDEKLAAIESLADMLRDVPGRKSVIYFSSGVERTGIENQAQLRATVDAANQSNVSLYAVDARGLTTLIPGGDASSASPAGTAVYSGQAMASELSSLEGSRETISSLATDTGGEMFSDLNDFSGAFKKVQEENSSYYLLGYTPSNTRSNGKFRRIRVQVDRPNVRVESRPGYFAPKNFRQLTREDKELQLEQALDSDTPFLDLPFFARLAYFPRPDGKFNVVLGVKIPGSEIPFVQKSTTHRTEFDVIWRVSDPSGKAVSVLHDTLPVKMNAEDYREILQGNILYEGQGVLPSGKYRIKIVVRENRSGKMGTFEMPLSLPKVSHRGLMLSAVVLSNELKRPSTVAGRRGKRAKPGHSPLSLGSNTILPSVTNVFRTNQDLYVYLESYGSRSTSSGRAPVSVQRGAVQPAIGLVFFRGGTKVAEAGPFSGRISGSSRGSASYLVKIPLDKFPLGRYSLQVNVLDPLTDQVAFAHVPLAIVKLPAHPSSGKNSLLSHHTSVIFHP